MGGTYGLLLAPKCTVLLYFLFRNMLLCDTGVVQSPVPGWASVINRIKSLLLIFRFNFYDEATVKENKNRCTPVLRSLLCLPYRSTSWAAAPATSAWEGMSCPLVL